MRNKKIRKRVPESLGMLSLCFIALFLVAFKHNEKGKDNDQTPGQTAPMWSEGYLDIHFINTGRGEASFFIFPDGTTMLLDAGVTSAHKPRVTDAKPDDSRTPAEWIARYIMHFMEVIPRKELDYTLVSHFHEDHVGAVLPGLKRSLSGEYVLTGISEVYEFIPFNTLIDRGWPDYNIPESITGTTAENYIRFVKWQEKSNGLHVEQFRAGTCDQITLLYNPQKYPGFEIRNIAVNGHIWTGVASNERAYYPSVYKNQKQYLPTENMCSAVIRLSYGKFDYFSGGDIYCLTPEPWQDLETPIGRVTGPVEVCKANHHANFDTMGKMFLQSLQPRVILIQTWLAQQPDLSVLRRIFSNDTYYGPRDVFATNVMNETKVVVGNTIDDLTSSQGHIIVRVSPGGDEFIIYVLDDSVESFSVKSVHGPYKCN